MLVRRCGDKDIAFKFAKTVKLGPKETITVWSSGENKKHEPPHTIVMKNQKWNVSDIMETVLQNKDGDVMIFPLLCSATMNSRKKLYNLFLNFQDVASMTHRRERRLRSRTFGQHGFGSQYRRVATFLRLYSQ